MNQSKNELYDQIKILVAYCLIQHPDAKSEIESIVDEVISGFADELIRREKNFFH